MDDDPDLSASTWQLLRTLGHDFRDVCDGQAALLVALRWAPDVALIDLRMPGMDGCELARRIRRLGGMAEALLVAMTGRAEPEDVARARQAGFNAFLPKLLELGPVDGLLRTEIARRDD